MDSRPLYCCNCGQVGHVFRHCVSPVTSYGVIAVRYTNDALNQAVYTLSGASGHPSTSFEFLLIRRKDSLSFIEFVRGKFSFLDEEYIGSLLRNMTQTEQQLLLTFTFDQLWHHIWGDSSHVRSHKSNYDVSERRFLQLQESLPRLVRANPSPWTEPEWGFPKGRRNPHESDVHCAIREFQEETGLRRHEFQIVQNTGALTETFFGSNHVHYCHKYYLAICPSNTNVRFHSHNPHMSKEVGDIAWFTLEDAMARIRPDKVEKREILLRVGKLLKAFYPVVGEGRNI